MPHTGSGYLRTPTICGDDVVFACEDDLWLVGAGGGQAHRLTAGVNEASGPRLSPDGRLVAFVGREEGPPDVYVMPTAGGAAQRLTYQGGLMLVVGFDPDGASVLFATDAERPHFRDRRLYRVGVDGGLPVQLPYGYASSYATSPAGATVLGRVVDEPARWKRYRGGRTGDLWVAPAGAKDYRRLITIGGNLASPCWIGERIYFLSDHESVGNVYSCTAEGADLRRHTDHEDYYARNLSGDGTRLVYHAGAELYLLDPAEDRPHRIDVRLASSRTQRNRQFVDAARHLQDATLSPDGARLAITARGKAFTFGNWAGPVLQHGQPDGVRYRLLTYLAGSERLIAAASDEGDQERLVLLPADGGAAGTIEDITGGLLADLVIVVARTSADPGNRRAGLTLVVPRGDAPTATVLDRSGRGQISDLAWSADGGWLAYTFPLSFTTSAIKLARPATGETVLATAPVLRDHGAVFDPQGRYLYFIGKRDLDPVRDELQFEYSFPLGGRPYAITLRADLPAPFVPAVEPLEEARPPAPAEAADKADDKDRDQAKPAEVVIDLAGITRRVVAFPLPEGRYEQLGATADTVLFTSYPVQGARAEGRDAPVDRTLESFDLKTLECTTFASGITEFEVGRDHKTLLYFADGQPRVVKATQRPGDGTEPGRTSGWVDLYRVRVSVRPDAEWRQMYREAWRLQREHFWVEDMSGIDWQEVYQRYLPLVDRVGTRAEFSDLLWELQGELGTSHAYEQGGAYRQGPHYEQGLLGVDWEVDGGSGAHRIARVYQGDVWSAGTTSPFNRPGVDVRAGDEVLAVNGIPVGGQVTVAQLLVNQAGQEVALTVRRPDGERSDPRTVTVHALDDERPVRYRDWVEGNRALVHERTDGRVGYLHIPDMTAIGYAEFHRGYLAEYDRDALIVDVRHNRGGHVSGLLLQRLARRRLGYSFSRWSEPEPYPYETVRGALVALTNEHAGSDGDIFSHSFKALGLGPLIGRRTWGGVIGIWPRHALADGTVTTQPEFSFTFDDVGWRVENYGTDPTIEVDIAPQDYVRGEDTQLLKGIEVALAELVSRPPHAPDLTDRPRLTRVPLPPRP